MKNRLQDIIQFKKKQVKMNLGISQQPDEDLQDDMNRFNYIASKYAIKVLGSEWKNPSLNQIKEGLAAEAEYDM